MQLPTLTTTRQANVLHRQALLIKHLGAPVRDIFESLVANRVHVGLSTIMVTILLATISYKPNAQLVNTKKEPRYTLQCAAYLTRGPGLTLDKGWDGPSACHGGQAHP